MTLGPVGLIALAIVALVAGGTRDDTAARELHSRPVQTCRQASNVQRNVGVAYTGTINNDDYHISVQVPPRLSGWGGVATSAPFHGFVVFLDSAEQACVVFEIHLRVDDGDAAIRPEAAKAVLMEGAHAWQVRTAGPLGGVTMSNVRTVFTWRHGPQAYDGTVLLVTPVSHEGPSGRVYSTLLRSLTFH
jgi:hypothetical protein